MKLHLSQDRGIQILSATGPVELRDIQVLGAGVRKLIRDGKNQIILETNEPVMPDDLIRELMSLDLVARELSGRLVLVTASAELKTKIENFARPMTLEAFPDRGLALNFFEKINAAPLGPIPGVEGPAPAAPPEASPAPATQVTQPAQGSPEPEEQIKQLKEEIRQRELKDLGQLRETISRLENENKALLDQFKTYFRERRNPPDERAYQQRIADLEARVEQLMDEMGKEMAK